MSEESQIGSVSFSTYMSYVNAAGGVSIALFVVAMYTIASGSVIFTDWWLSMWINSMSMKVRVTFTLVVLWNVILDMYFAVMLQKYFLIFRVYIE